MKGLKNSPQYTQLDMGAGGGVTQKPGHSDQCATLPLRWGEWSQESEGRDTIYLLGSPGLIQSKPQ